MWAVLPGYMPGEGARSTMFGSLLLGYYEGTTLKYAGRVGSGFDTEMLRSFLEPLQLLENDQCPFAYDKELPKTQAHWISPKIVVQVKFAEWTDEDRVRAPVFMGITLDVDPEAVSRAVK